MNLLLDYNVVSTTRTKQVYTLEPHFIDKKQGEEFIQSSEKLHKLVMKVVRGINTEFNDYKKYIPEFPFRNEILNMQSELPEFLWTRYDGFFKEDGIFYSEFNYDKPCAQRECALMEEQGYGEQLTLNFRKNLSEALIRILKGRFQDKQRFNIAFLTAPSKYEETHLGIFLKEMFQSENKQVDLDIILTGPTNLYIEEDTLKAFNKNIDVVIRLYPTEFMYECTCFKEMIKLHELGKILILNDPRAILAQSKSLYAYLWKLVLTKDDRLSMEERESVLKYLPYTEILDKYCLEKARKNKNSFVIKPVFGRYSIDVFIGMLHNEKEWEESLNYVEKIMNEKPFILQSFEKIEDEVVICDNGGFKHQIQSFGNYGIFLGCDKVIGNLIRWNADYLTDEDTTFITPIGLKDREIRLSEISVEALERIKSKALIEYGFSGAYVKNYDYLSVNVVTISEKKLRELSYATDSLAKIFLKTQNAIKANLEVFSEILAIEDLKEFLNQEKFRELCFIGRMDFIIDKCGNLKVLEINSETPAGIIEAINIQGEYFNEIKANNELIDPNKVLKEKLKVNARNIINKYKNEIKVETIAILGTTYYEDFYTMKGIFEVLKEEFPECELIIGNIYDLEVRGEEVYVYGRKIDAMYRYFPLDWFNQDDEMKKVLPMFNKKVISLNPLQSIISQSKGFFSAIYELLKYNFYSKEEAEIIQKYIPLTSYDYRDLNTANFVVKPMLGREGEGVKISSEINNFVDSDVVFQELIYSETVKAKVKVCNNKWRENLYPVIGAFVVNEEFAGVFTRLGGKITKNICMYAPLFGEKGDE
ncbi:Glutathionylspermidine synthase [Clostridium cavendishii DSM 21758]|uniref:Glutathionylspermidine synthase n=1 Tax=Clostridium cavendishii DSM 21758 TaxID=1121302 RepID=A0A1M6QHV0_9CLOT|nr:glutathionylspermidine synthase family protein [Clostridium cavendishii]SHK19904.1 Glutathionylspermidine synthase [Clostridium cavendishii DSM 21758]